MIKSDYDNNFYNKLRDEILDYISNQSSGNPKRIRRFKHMLKTEEMVKKTVDNLKGKFHIRENSIRLAALLHDITKDYPESKQRNILRQIKIPKEDIKIKGLWHAWTASEIAKIKFKISNRYILDLIRYHPTGHKNFDLGGLIFFISDFCEETRTHTGVEEVRKLLAKDVKKAGILTIKFKTSYLINDNAYLHSRGINFYNRLIQEGAA